ncbi:MAG: hypothetical protein K2H09_02420 [Treponemataceae bacterium]|nr:hypothetical protein [Treponemataceae bacterium]
MKQIEGFYLGGLNNAAHFSFVSEAAEKAAGDAAVAEKCAEQVAALRACLAAEDEGLMVSAKSPTTDKICAADRQRDVLYSGFKKAVAGYEGFPDKDMAEAAAVLGQLIRMYKIDVQGQMDKETGLLVNFIQDLETKCAEQVAALSLGAFVARLKDANESVRSLTMQRTGERAAKTAGALRAARTACDSAYKALVQNVNARALLEGDAEYSAFIDWMNAQIAHYRQAVLGGRKGRAKEAKESKEAKEAAE